MDSLIEAQAGFCAFHAMVDDVKGLRGPRNAANKAFLKAIQGLRTAFPESMAQQALSKAVEDASTTCAALFVQDLEARGDLHEEDPQLYHDIFEGLSLFVA